MTAPALILPGRAGGGEFRRWILAAAIVLASHAVLMAGYLLMEPEPPKGAPLAPAVLLDLAPMPVAPSSPLDLAPGPEMTEAEPPEETPPVEPQVVESVPKIETMAEVALPLPEPKAVEQKPEEKPEIKKPEPKKKKAERKPPAPRTTASPRSEHRAAAKPAAPSVGSAASRAAAATWRDMVLARLQHAKRYPGDARSRREQGVATLSFRVDRNGRVLSRHLVRSSGSSSLDEEVLSMVMRAQPLPSFPPAMTQSVISLSVPIRFSLR